MPYGAIAAATVERSKTPQERDGFHLSPDGVTAFLAVGGKTQAVVTLVLPVPIRGYLKRPPPMTTVRVAVDEPEAFVAAIRERMASVRKGAG